MNILFVHKNFPGQFGALAEHLSRSTHHRVAFLTNDAKATHESILVRKFAAKRAPAQSTHHYLQGFEAGVLNGQAAFEACFRMKQEGFTPDVILAHCGWGVPLYLREVFPAARLIGYFEWYYHPHGVDADYTEPALMTPDNACRIRTMNAPLLMLLEDADLGLVPTDFQREQLPRAYQDKLLTLHDGVDTDYFKPATGVSRRFAAADFTDVPRLVTYATRGMEPYRGFPEFMQAVDGLLRRDKTVHVAIAGEDRAFYSRQLPDGDTYQKKALRELPNLDLTRVHFLGTLPRDDYRRLLQISSVHVYLTVPFVPSWSLIEAMACGCQIIASDTKPAREVLGDDSVARFIEHRDVAELEKVMALALNDASADQKFRSAARNRAVMGFSATSLLPKWEAALLGNASKVPGKNATKV